MGKLKYLKNIHNVKDLALLISHDSIGGLMTASQKNFRKFLKSVFIIIIEKISEDCYEMNYDDMKGSKGTWSFKFHKILCNETSY